MLSRAKQFLAAIGAKVTAADREFVAARLSPAEQALFFGMNLPDQRHALNVAYTALELAAGRSDVDEPLLAKAALLHDVGKARRDVSTWDKVLTVLLHKLAPGRARDWGRRGRGGRLQNFRHAVYIYFAHGDIGAARLAEAGADRRIADMARRHHQAAGPADSVELTLLRQADELN